MPKKTQQALLTLAALAAVSACGDQADPVSLDLSPELSVVDACHAVEGTLVESFAGADFPNNVFYFGGPISGSLEGTSFAALTGSENPAGGQPRYVVFGAGTRTVTVTGGSVDALVGSTLVFELEQMNIVGAANAKGQVDRMTLVSGARGGHLTGHGQFDFTTYTYTATYRGSICP